MIYFNIIATDQIDFDILSNQEKLFEVFLFQDKNGYLGLESAYIDNHENLEKLISFLFRTNENFSELNDGIFDLSGFKDNCISLDELEDKYQDWLRISSRENTMDEYGNLLGIVSYVKRNIDKQDLLLVIEK